MIHAKKTLGEKTITRTFTDQTWKRMGKNKEGWKIDPKETAKANGEKVEKPSELKKVDDTDADAKAKEDQGAMVAEDAAAEANKDISNITIPDVIIALKALKTVQEVNDYVGKDDRSGVEKAVTKRIGEIEAAAE
jgi:hypothetical protein